MIRILAAALAVALLALVLLGWRLSVQSASLEQAQEAARTLGTALVATQGKVDGLTAAAGVQARSRALLERQHKESSDALSTALKKDPAWADQRVPGDVADALRVQYPTQD